jgi:hypothetical protein
MNYYDVQQQGAWANPQIASLFNPQMQMMPQFAQAFSSGLGQAAYAQPYGQFGYGQQPFGGFAQSGGWGIQPNMQSNAWGSSNGWGPSLGSWGQQRQLSQQDVGEVVRQLLPMLPQILAQAQPQAIGYAAYGMPQQRQLSPQDVNEIVRQLLPVVPQIVSALQTQPQPQQAAMYGGFGAGQFGQGGLPSHYAAQHLGSPFSFGQSFQQQPVQQQPWQQFGQAGWPYAQAAFGGAQGAWGTPWGQQSGGQQRQLSQQDVTEVARQLVGIIPQVIGNLQAYAQQRPI